MIAKYLTAALAAALFLALGACSDDDDDGDAGDDGGGGARQVAITQAEDGCTPVTITAEPGEELALVVTNDTDKLYEIEGEEDAGLEEKILRGGETVTIPYTVPEGGAELECYSPEGGPETIIEIEVPAGS